MSDLPDVPLEEQRLSLRAELQAGRQALAAQLSADRAPPGSFPRSVTMQWLLRQPGMAVVLIRWLMLRPRLCAALATGALAWGLAQKARRALEPPGAPPL